MINELESLGLTEREAKVYEALVKYGPCKAGLLIVRLDIHRSMVYESLDTLIQKGFATKISKRGVWWFQITEPDSLITALKRKKQIADAVIDEIKLYRQQANQQIVVYEGIDSYRSYWLSSVERFPEDTVDYTVGVNTREWNDLMGPALDEYLNLRIKKRYVWKTVHFEITPTEKEFLRRYPDLTEYRLWSKNISPVGNFNVVHDTVILQSMRKDAPRIIEIRDADMVIIFKNYFDAIWEEATPVTL